MLQHYLNTSLRNLKRAPLNAGIKIIGLAIGLAGCILISLYVHRETSFDEYHPHKQRIFRVVEKQNQAGIWYDVAKTPGPLANVLSERFPSVEKVGHFLPNKNLLLQTESFSSDGIQGIYAEPEMVDLLGLQFIEGSQESAFDHSHAIILTQRLAERIFGSENALGKRLSFQGDTTLEVRGVIQDLPGLTHLPLDCLIPITYLEDRFGLDRTNWNQNIYYTYLQLKVDETPESVTAGINAFSREDLEWEWVSFSLQPLSDIYLHSSFAFNTDFGPRGNDRHVHYATLIALALLLIACINFINLSVAMASGRLKEIGMRKVSGASRKQLMSQFMGEACITVSLSFLVGLTLTQLTLPYFNTWTQLDLHWPPAHSFLWTLGAIFLGTVGLSGLYPAWILSGKAPQAGLLTSEMGSPKRGIPFHQYLVIFQFAIAISLMGFTLGMAMQLDFLKGKNLGFEKEDLVYINLPGDLIKSYPEIKHSLSGYPEIQSVSATNFYSMPFEQVGSGNMYHWPHKAPGDEFYISSFRVDHQFLQTLGLNLVQGRNFDPALQSDSSTFIINQTAASIMGLADPVGESINPFNQGMGPIIGVVEDFHFASLHAAIEPVFIQLQPQNIDYLLVRVHPEKRKAGLDRVRKTLDAFQPERPYRVQFLDETYQEAYQAEQLSGQICQAFALLALFISSLGLLGLALFSSHKRTKEIGIRKVLGASVLQVTFLLVKSFLKLVLVAMLISLPFTWWGIQRWLETFAYSLQFPIWIWILPSMAALLIALFTIGIHTWSVARRNPVESLRYE